MDLVVDNYGRMSYPTNPDGAVAEGSFPVVVFAHGRFHSGPTRVRAACDASDVHVQVSDAQLALAASLLAAVTERAVRAAAPREEKRDWWGLFWRGGRAAPRPGVEGGGSGGGIGREDGDGP